MDKYDFAGCLSLMSAVTVLWATNCVTPSRYITYFEHEKGTVCPFGIQGGRLSAVICFIQAYMFFNRMYVNELKQFVIAFTYFVFASSFLNSLVMKRLVLFFTVQYMILLSICL